MMKKQEGNEHIEKKIINVLSLKMNTNDVKKSLLKSGYTINWVTLKAILEKMEKENKINKEITGYVNKTCHWSKK